MRQVILPDALFTFNINTLAFMVQKHWFARGGVLEKRYRLLAPSSFAYTQTIDCLYPNNRVSILKRLFAYTQIETYSSTSIIYLYLGIDVLFASWRHQQLRILALGPLG